MRSHPFFDQFDPSDRPERGERRRYTREDGDSPYDDPGFRGRRDFGRGPGPGHHGPGRGGHPGPPPWLAGLFGWGRPEHGRGPRVRRGDVRQAILDVLHSAASAEGAEPLNGYQVIGQITERSGGAWKPSPGSVYPTVNQLEDEGLVAVDETAGRRSLRLTEAGTAYCEEHAEELAAVWAPFADDPAEADAKTADIKSEIGQVMGAVWQIASSGSESQRRAAVDVLVDTRRRLYGILADGPDQD